jgi:hypothetical protein
MSFVKRKLESQILTKEWRGGKRASKDEELFRNKP